MSDIIMGEEFSEKISIDTWLAKRSEIEPIKELKKVYQYLVKHGKYFSNQKVDDTSLKTIPWPEQIERQKCHDNTLLYVSTLFLNHNKRIEDFRFATGIYSLEAIDDDVPLDKRYVIYHHSFITYKGLILDWTKIAYPPIGYTIEHYFGVEYTIETAKQTLVEIVREPPKNPIVLLTCFLDKPISKPSNLLTL